MNEPTVEELIGIIQHSDLPNVLVEGKTDVSVYRKMESLFSPTKPDFLLCNGRSNLLKIYSRRQEFSNKQVCFVADRDMWIFTNVPAEFNEIIFSEGYSIENDLYFDSDIERLLVTDERQNHSTLIIEIARWFACEVEKCVRGSAYCITPKMHLLAPLPNFTCCPNHLNALGFVEPSKEVYADVLENYKLKLRGKLLYEILLRFLSAQKRRSKYSRENLMEISVIDSIRKTLFPRILKSISQRLGLEFAGGAGSEQLSLPIEA